MSGREKPLILQNGMPIPQAYDKDLGDWTEYSTEHIKAIKAELALVKAELQAIKQQQIDGSAKVSLSGAIVEDYLRENLVPAGVIQSMGIYDLRNHSTFVLAVRLANAKGTIYATWLSADQTTVFGGSNADTIGEKVTYDPDWWISDIVLRKSPYVQIFVKNGAESGSRDIQMYINRGIQG